MKVVGWVGWLFWGGEREEGSSTFLRGFPSRSERATVELRFFGLKLLFDHVSCVILLEQNCVEDDLRKTLR